MADREALIIANANYQNARLKQLRAPSKDADALEQVLANPDIGDFHVEVKTDEPYVGLTRKLSAFFRNRNQDDLLVVHFSGHGVRDLDGELYLAAADTDPDQLDATAIEAGWLRKVMNRSDSNRIIVLLDCCYAGAITRGMLARGDERVDSKELFEGRGRVILTATDSIQYAFEGTEVAGEPTPSIFTTAVVEGLSTGAADRDGDGWVSVQELYSYVHDAVKERTPGMRPRICSPENEGDLRIARSPLGPQVELPPDLLEAISSPKAWLRRGAADELGRLLTGPDRSLADAARVRLQALTLDDSASVAEAARRLLQLREGRTPADPKEIPGPATPSPPPPRPRESRNPDSEFVRGQARLPHDNPVHGVCLSPAGMLVATTDSSATLRVWDVSDQRELWTADHARGGVGVFWSLDGRMIASYTEGDTKIRVWDAQTGEELATLTYSDAVAGCVWGARGRLLSSSVGFAPALVWDCETRSELARLDGTRPTTTVAWSPDGRRALTASSDGHAHIWDVPSGEEVLRLSHPRGFGVLARPVVGMSWSPDSRLIATTTSDAKTRLWDADQGLERQRLKTPELVSRLIWSPDSLAIATMPGRDGYSRPAVWDAVSGRAAVELQPCTCLEWTPDSTYVVVNLRRTVVAQQVFGGRQSTKMAHIGVICALAWNKDDPGWINVASVAARRSVLIASWRAGTNAESDWAKQETVVYERINKAARALNANLNSYKFPNQRIGPTSGLDELPDVLGEMDDDALLEQVRLFLRRTGAL